MPLEVYRRGSGDAALGIGAVAADTPAVFPIPKPCRLTVEGRSPAGNWTLGVFAGPLTGGTATLVASFTCTVAVPLHVALVLDGEIGALVLTNGAVAQSPEILATLDDEEAA